MEQINFTWRFPADIRLEEVTMFLKEFDRMPQNRRYTFDLSNTIYIHSSYIGFLIYAKEKLEKADGEINLIVSSSLARVFKMLKMSDFFKCKYVY